MSRHRVCIGILGSALATLAPLAPSRADVLEISGDSANWVAGGPRASTTYETSNAPEDANAGLTAVADHAGPAAWSAHVASLAAKYDISPALLEALVWQESRWRTGSVSSAGARGLAQLMPGTARDLGVNPDDPAANLEGGARYLRQQLDTFDGDIERALAAYNAGPHRVHKAGGIPAIRETQQYVAAIMARLSDPVRR